MKTTNISYKLELGDMFTHLVDCDDYGCHSHDFYEIFYIVSGSIKHRLNNVLETLREGDLILIKPSQKHEFLRPANCTHRDVIFSCDFFEGLCSFIGKDVLNQISSLSRPTILSSNKILYFEKLLDEYNFNVLYDDKTRKSIATAVASEIVLAIITSQTVNKENGIPLWFNQLLDKFNEPEFIKGGIPLILSSVKYNKIYVERIFKKHMGITMTAYLNSVRLKYAELKIRTTNSNIVDIVENTGFSSPTYFYSLFKKHFGITPNEYRNRMFNKL